MKEAERLYLESSKSFEQLSLRSKTSQDLSHILDSSQSSGASTPTPKSASSLPLDSERNSRKAATSDENYSDDFSDENKTESPGISPDVEINFFDANKGNPKSNREEKMSDEKKIPEKKITDKNVGKKISEKNLNDGKIMEETKIKESENLVGINNKEINKKDLYKEVNDRDNSSIESSKSQWYKKSEDTFQGEDKDSCSIKTDKSQINKSEITKVNNQKSNSESIKTQISNFEIRSLQEPKKLTSSSSSNSFASIRNNSTNTSRSISENHFKPIERDKINQMSLFNAQDKEMKQSGMNNGVKAHEELNKQIEQQKEELEKKEGMIRLLIEDNGKLKANVSGLKVS